MSFIVLFSLTVSSVLAQCNLPSVLVDDFARSRRMFFDGANRQVNLLNADYGTDDPKTTMTVDTQAKTMTVVPGTNDAFFFAKYVSYSSKDTQ